ncbi:hypothetical protein MTO96_020926 [Rhipicephalus appendiculatus]
MHHGPVQARRNNGHQTQVFGEKYIRLYEKSQTGFLYPYEERLLENTSQVDVENPDHEKFPLFKTAQYTECVLRPGEMLFIPPKVLALCALSFTKPLWEYYDATTREIQTTPKTPAIESSFSPLGRSHKPHQVF